MGSFFGKAFPADAQGGKAKTCQLRACTRLGLFSLARRGTSFLGPKKKKRFALGTNARPARFRPGLVEERQEWDESFLNSSAGPLKLPNA